MLTLNWEQVHWDGLTNVCGTLVPSWLVWHSSIIYFLLIQKHRLWRQHQNSLNPIITNCLLISQNYRCLTVSLWHAVWTLDFSNYQLHHGALSQAGTLQSSLRSAFCVLMMLQNVVYSNSGVKYFNARWRTMSLFWRASFLFLTILWLTFHFYKLLFPSKLAYK